MDHQVFHIGFEKGGRKIMHKRIKSIIALFFLLPMERGHTEPEYDFTLQTLTYASINTAAPFKADGIYRVIFNTKQDFLKLNGVFQMGFHLPLTHESTSVQRGDFENFYYSIYRTLYRSKNKESRFNLNSGFNGWLGFSRESRQRDLFRASIRPFLTLSFKKGAFFTNQTFRFGHRFYNQRMRADGQSLIPNEFTSITELKYYLTKKWSFDLTFLYNYGITFQNMGKSASIMGYYSSYRVEDDLLVSLGLETQDNNLMPDGVRRRVTVFDPGVTQLVFDLKLKI